MNLNEFARRGIAAQAAANEAIQDALPATQVLMDLPTRAYNTLHEQRITLGELRRIGPKQLLRIKNFSTKSFNAIVAALDARGLTHKLGPKRSER